MREATPKPENENGAPGRARRRSRLLIRAGVLAGIVIIGAWLGISKSGVLRGVVLPRLQAALPCDVSCGRVTLSGGGAIVVQDVVLRIPGVDGEPGEFLRAPKLVVNVNWFSSLTGRSAVSSLTLVRPLVRISQAPDSTLNVQAIPPSGSGVPARIPGINVNGGTLSLGEHFGRDYSELAQVRVSGSLTPQQGSEAFTFLLRELPSDPKEKKSSANRSLMTIDGSVSVADAAGFMRLRNVDLSSWSSRAAPTPVREIWRQMAMSGWINDAVFEYSESSGTVVRLDLQDVDLNIPVPREQFEDEQMSTGAVAEADSLIAMRDVSGRLNFSRRGVSANMKGTIEDLSCEVLLSTQGLSLTSPLDCKIIAPDFKVAERPNLLPFAPDYVRRIFNQFSNPRTDMSGVVQLVRREPVDGVQAPLEVSGALRFANGSAQFDSFPYPIGDLRGTVLFDPETIEIVNVSGVGPTGASFLLTGRIFPPREGAQVDLDISIAGVPIDDPFWEAVPPERKAVLDAVFSHSQYDKLQAQGLVISSAERERLEAKRREIDSQRRGDRLDPAARDELARIASALERPVLDLTGMGDIRARVHRPPGPTTEYETTIDLRVHEAGLVADQFPYPTLARNVHIHIGKNLATVDVPELRGMTGAHGRLSAWIGFSHDGSSNYEPKIHISAEEMPVDRFLLHALRETRAGNMPRAETSGASSPAAIVERMNLEGVVSCEAKIENVESSGITVTTDVTFDGLRARPMARELIIADLTGRITSVQQDIAIERLEGTVNGAPFTMAMRIEASEGMNSPEINGLVTIHGVSLSDPLDALVEAAAPAQGQQAGKLRRRFEPQGEFSGALRLSMAESEISIDASVAQPTKISFRAMDERFTLSDVSGQLGYHDGWIEFENVAGMLEEDSEPLASLRLGGQWFGETDLPADAIRSGRVDVRLEDCNLSAPVVARMISKFSVRASEWIRQYQVGGRAGVNIAVRGDGRAPEAAMSIEPSVLSFVVNEQTVHMTDIKGRVTGSAAGGAFEQLSAEGEGWWVEINGPWWTKGERAATFAVDGGGIGFPDELRAALPTEVRNVFDAIAIDLDGGFTLSSAELHLDREMESQQLTAGFRGDVHVDDARFDAAIAFRSFSGGARIAFDQKPESGADQLTVQIAADSMNAAGMAFHDVRATLRAVDPSQGIEVRDITGTVYGGALAGHAVLVRGDSESDAGSLYEINIDATGVDIAALLNDVRRKNESNAEEQAQERGTIDANVSITGRTDDSRSRRGRGLLRAQGGDVVHLPGVMPLLRLSNLQPPMGEKLNFAYADLYLRGDEVHFTDLQASSPSLQIIGTGMMTMPDLALDLRFTTRGTQRLPILSDLLEGLRDELIVTVVRGTLRDPELSYEQLTATRRMLDTIFGRDPDRRESPEVKPVAAARENGKQ